MVIHQVIAAITSKTFQYETNIEMKDAVDQKMEHEEYSNLKRSRKGVKIPTANTDNSNMEYISCPIPAQQQTSQVQRMPFNGIHLMKTCQRQNTLLMFYL